MTSDPLYRNPFADYNANKMDTKMILDLWCSPFEFHGGKLQNSQLCSEAELFRHQMPIILVGGRGTGKTMLLKYFSYAVQIALAERESGSNSVAAFTEFLAKRGALGLYLRIDGPLLRSFSGKGLCPERWMAIFCHYFELRVCRGILEILGDLRKRGILSADNIEGRFLRELMRLLGVESMEGPTFEKCLDVIDSDICAVTTFRSEVVFADAEFVPRKAFAAGDLFAVFRIIREHASDLLRDFTFPVLIDEYENFSCEQQRQINTLVKCVPDGTTFRIGMRFEGFRTHETVNEREFLKVGRDYQQIVFEQVLIKDQAYQEFLVTMAEKRLRSVPALREKRFTDIRSILGPQADVEAEGKRLVRGRGNEARHFELLRSRLSGEEYDRAVKLLSCPERPLIEMLNILWVIRGREPNEVAKAMRDYIARRRSDLARKYRLDFVDKYKLSLMFLLCSLYRADKDYASFNTYCFLSSGIVGNFIELCRRAFQTAYFEARVDLLEHGRISPEIQTASAREVAESELQMINRIHDHGESLYRFVVNLGNIFKAHHNDPNLTYPETNQFSVEVGNISDATLKAAFNAAVEWSLVQRKPKIQRTSPSAPRQVTYTLNRIFSPEFQISFRTRGGFSETFDEGALKQLMSGTVKPERRRVGRRRHVPDQTELDLSTACDVSSDGN